MKKSLTVFQALGDQRERAVTLGDIARIKVDKGEVDEALKLHQEELTVYQALGDVVGNAHVLWSIAQIEMQKEDYPNAFPHLQESYAILLKLGRLDGIIYVGLDLGQLLCAGGAKEEGMAILSRSRDGFRKLGQEAQARQVQALLDSLSS
ncbi:tetratricopeptide repeat protein [Candidatus Competibacter phosphatis]|uniref:Tetratricopeptide repeat protein n=1 Tax=Candidatus Competibacter phosphatis TaxID=221280 RepID=A0ABX1TP76_9GAMM|nr:tetratricopeptide repeat protein [Candidatus Competibacter phosphatis]